MASPLDEDERVPLQRQEDDVRADQRAGHPDHRDRRVEAREERDADQDERGRRIGDRDDQAAEHGQRRWTRQVEDQADRQRDQPPAPGDLQQRSDHDPTARFGKDLDHRGQRGPGIAAGGGGREQAGRAAVQYRSLERLEVRAAIDRDDPADRRQREAEPQLDAGERKLHGHQHGQRDGMAAVRGLENRQRPDGHEAEIDIEGADERAVGAGRQDARAARERQRQLRGDAGRGKRPDVLDVESERRAPADPDRECGADTVDSEANGQPRRLARHAEREAHPQRRVRRSIVQQIDANAVHPHATCRQTVRGHRASATGSELHARRIRAQIDGDFGVPPAAEEAGDDGREDVDLELAHGQRACQCRRCARGDQRYADVCSDAVHRQRRSAARADGDRRVGGTGQPDDEQTGAAGGMRGAPGAEVELDVAGGRDLHVQLQAGTTVEDASAACWG